MRQRELKSELIEKAIAKGMSKASAEEKADRIYDDKWFDGFKKKVMDAVQNENKRKRDAKVAEKINAEIVGDRINAMSNKSAFRRGGKPSNDSVTRQSRISETEVKKRNGTKISKGDRTRRRNRTGCGDIG